MPERITNDNFLEIHKKQSVAVCTNKVHQR